MNVDVLETIDRLELAIRGGDSIATADCLELLREAECDRRLPDLKRDDPEWDHGMQVDHQ